VRALRGERERERETDRQREVTTSRIVFQCFWPMILPWKQVFFFFFQKKKKRKEKNLVVALQLYSWCEERKSGKVNGQFLLFLFNFIRSLFLSLSLSLSDRLSHFFFFLSFSMVFLVCDYCEKAWFWPL
jgi:membrane protein CcdC involved in cytochrome C biogenesis